MADSLAEAIAGEHRKTENSARDVYRKPAEVLSFLGFTDDMTVVEIWPGGGWYTEILAPALQAKGQYIGAQYDLNAPYRYQKRAIGQYYTLIGGNKLYDGVRTSEFNLPYHLHIAPPATVDMVLTFRNVHNLFMQVNENGKYADLAFKAWFDALKSGGVLGVVGHRWDDPATESPTADNGYISEQRVIEYAERAGFRLDAKSELLANPKDSKDHQNGVWSLPPVLAVDDDKKDAMTAIGESDRFLLKFVKP